ncbi:PAS domain-containing protein [Streptomyces sp. NBC_00299]|uniref:PAS domain-containing protein n=1 Tax=Streptomyces sp. NBC_00299 TaxID=2975705 RepID=UPI002E29281E|nr:PAS domain-containing protein [Streptomyces sp. NBC_00299]
MTAEIEFTAFFDATPSPSLVMGTDLVIRYVNHAYLQATGRSRSELVGKYFFDVLPENPHAPVEGQRNLKASLLRVLETG